MGVNFVPLMGLYIAPVFNNLPEQKVSKRSHSK